MFCSILYYKELGEHIRRYYIEKRNILKNLDQEISDKIEGELYFFLKPFNGRLENSKIEEEILVFSHVKKRYSNKVLKKWHLFVMLIKNKDLIRYRKFDLKP